MAFEKTKLKTERHKKYLFCAEGYGYYTKANDVWSDYLKRDLESERDETVMSLYDFKDLAQNGMAIDMSAYRAIENDTTMFYVPYEKCLNLYWQAADIYVQKMHKDAQL